MVERSQIQIDLVKLTDGGRLLRLTESHSGLTLEKMLDPDRPVLRQKQRLIRLFEATLERAELTVG
jgi:hypothetical protein